MAADGTELSDPVILDNNIQTYKFYSKDTTSELGVSFNTIIECEYPIKYDGVDGASGKYNTFNIDKTIELVDKNNTVLGSAKLTENELAGKVNITANGITL